MSGSDGLASDRPDPSVSRNIQSPLKQDGRPVWTRVHSHVKVEIVHPERQAVALRIPIFFPIDRDDIELRSFPDIKRWLPSLIAPGVVFALSDAARGPATMVRRIVIVSAFGLKDQAQAFVEIRCNHDHAL